jgi:hypothetical protein
LVAEDKDQWHTEDADGIFKTGDGVVVGKVAGYAANENIAATSIERVLGPDPGVGAAEDPGKRVLSLS